MTPLDESVRNGLVGILDGTCKLKCELQKERVDIEHTERFGPHDEFTENHYDMDVFQPLINCIHVELKKIPRKYKELYDLGPSDSKDCDYTFSICSALNKKHQTLQEKRRMALRGFLGDINTILSQLSGVVESQRITRRFMPPTNNTKTRTVPLEHQLISDITDHIEHNMDEIEKLLKGSKQRQSVDSGIENDLPPVEKIKDITETLKILHGSRASVADSFAVKASHINDYMACSMSAHESRSRRQEGSIAIEHDDNEEFFSIKM